MEKYIMAAITVLLTWMAGIFGYGRLTQKTSENVKNIETLQLSQADRIKTDSEVVQRLTRLETYLERIHQDIQELKQVRGH